MKRLNSEELTCAIANRTGGCHKHTTYVATALQSHSLHWTDAAMQTEPASSRELWHFRTFLMNIPSLVLHL